MTACFFAGDPIRIVEDMDEDGFYQAVHIRGPDAGRQGLVPSNFLREATEEEVVAVDGAGDDANDEMDDGGTAADTEPDATSPAESEPAQSIEPDEEATSTSPPAEASAPAASNEGAPPAAETDDERRAREEREHAAEIEKALARKKKNKNKKKK